MDCPSSIPCGVLMFRISQDVNFSNENLALIPLVRKESTQTQEGGELCCKISAVFWRTGLGRVCKGCS